MNKELQEAIAVAKEAGELIRCGEIYAIEAGMVHLSQKYFEKNLSERERTRHSKDYDRIDTCIDGVRVFCLVKKEKQPDEVAHQSV